MKRNNSSLSQSQLSSSSEHKKMLQCSKCTFSCLEPFILNDHNQAIHSSITRTQPLLPSSFSSLSYALANDLEGIYFLFDFIEYINFVFTEKLCSVFRFSKHPSTFTLDKDRWNKLNETGDDFGLNGSEIQEILIQSGPNNMFEALSVALYPMNQIYE